MNYMDKVAQILGVELNEEFSIKEDDWGTVYRLTTDGMEERPAGRACFVPVLDMSGLLTGHLTVVKKPWVPKQGDEYYCIILWDEKEEVFRTYWRGSRNDLYNKITGNIFTTREEAVANMSRYKEYLIGKEPDLSWRD